MSCLFSTDRADDDNEDYKQSTLMMLKENLYLSSLGCFEHSDPNLAKYFQISLMSDTKFYLYTCHFFKVSSTGRQNEDLV